MNKITGIQLNGLAGLLSGFVFCRLCRVKCQPGDVGGTSCCCRLYGEGRKNRRAGGWLNAIRRLGLRNQWLCGQMDFYHLPSVQSHLQIVDQPGASQPGCQQDDQAGGCRIRQA